MKALQFMVWLRDELGVIRHSKEGDKLKAPSNGELRRWITNGVLFCNGKTVALTDVVEWPIDSLVLFPGNSKARVTLV